MRTLPVSFVVLLLVLAAPANALRPVRVYEAVVPTQAEASVQAQSGLRQVLVRAVGSRDAANDPALAGILSQAEQYVIASRPAASGTTLVFDAAALERDITAAGRSIWPSERPLLLIVLTGGPATGAFESRRQVEGALDATANRRGQPIRVVRPEALGLSAAGELPGDAAFAAAQRLGADAVLIGYGDAVPGGGPWRWSLTAAAASDTWTGSLEDGVNASADVFARNATAMSGMPDLPLLVEFEGIASLREYARVSELLAQAPGVRTVQLADAAASRAVFSVVTRGGTDILQGVLASNPNLQQIDAKAGSLAFRYTP